MFAAGRSRDGLEAVVTMVAPKIKDLYRRLWNEASFDYFCAGEPATGGRLVLIFPRRVLKRWQAHLRQANCPDPKEGAWSAISWLGFAVEDLYQAVGGPATLLLSDCLAGAKEFENASPNPNGCRNHVDMFEGEARAAEIVPFKTVAWGAETFLIAVYAVSDGVGVPVARARLHADEEAVVTEPAAPATVALPRPRATAAHVARQALAEIAPLDFVAGGLTLR